MPNPKGGAKKGENDRSQAGTAPGKTNFLNSQARENPLAGGSVLQAP